MAEPILILETGAGLPNSNSYVSRSEASLILSSRPDSYKSSWIALDDYQEDQLLIWGTLLLDDWVIWPGIQSHAEQALGFPRLGVVNPSGYLLPGGTVYPFVKRATVEMALTLSGENVTVEPTRGLDLLKVGPITLDFSGKESEKAKVIPRSVFSILMPFGCRLRSSGSASIGSLALERA